MNGAQKLSAERRAGAVAMYAKCKNFASSLSRSMSLTESVRAWVCEATVAPTVSLAKGEGRRAELSEGRTKVRTCGAADVMAVWARCRNIGDFAMMRKAQNLAAPRGFELPAHHRRAPRCV